MSVFTPRVWPSNERVEWPARDEKSGIRAPGIEDKAYIGPDGVKYVLLRAPCTLPSCYCDIIAIPSSLTDGLSDEEVMARFVCTP